MGERSAAAQEPGESWELLRIFLDQEGAEEPLRVLREAGLPCGLQDRQNASPEELGEAAAGVWLLVPRERRAEAEACLAARDVDIESPAPGELRCTSCDAKNFAAVPPDQSPAGSWWLRCANCGRRTPVAEAAYLSEAYHLLPTACPECGSFRVSTADPPEASGFDMTPASDLPWCLCESCEHRWQPAAMEKGPGNARPGEAAAPQQNHALEAVPQDLLEAPPGAPADPSSEEDPGEDGPQCPRCLSRRLAMNNALLESERSIRFLCTRCGEVWDQAFPPGATLPDLPAMSDGDATAEPSPACPQCGGAKSEPCEAPPYAAESGLARFFKRLFGGRQWRHCLGCGSVWEA